MRKIFFKDNVLLHHLETGIDRQFGVLNNLNLDEMETKSKSNLSNMEQKELSKLSNDKSIVIKHADKGGAVVILSTGHYQSMIMQNLLDENRYKKLASRTKYIAIF